MTPSFCFLGILRRATWEMGRQMTVTLVHHVISLLLGLVLLKTSLKMLTRGMVSCDSHKVQDTKGSIHRIVSQ